MNTGELLLRAVLCDPGDDTARLAFADHLEEHGGERRAGFVRDCKKNWPVVFDLQDELLSLRPGLTVSGFGKQADDDGGRPYWRFGIPGGIGESVLFVFDRGFVDEVRLPAAEFTEQFARELFSRHPVTRVVLTDREPEDLGYGYCWRFEGLANGPENLPDFLENECRGEAEDTVWVRATAADCVRSASAIAIARGRKLAGLPPLPHASGGA